MPRPFVAYSSPEGWPLAPEVPRPPLAEGSGATFIAWDATRSATGDEALVVACVETPIPGWVPEMEQAVTSRSIGVLGAAAERVVGVPIEPRPKDDGFALRVAGEPEEALPVGRARAFLGFHDHAVVTCFAICARTASRRDARTTSPLACEAAVQRASLEGSDAPPAPGIVVGSVTWAVHHPSRAALGGAFLVAVLAVVAVMTRRKPRSRI